MRLTTLLLLSVLLFGLTGCETTQKRAASSADSSSVTEPNEDRAFEQQVAARTEVASSQNVSLTQADSANASSQAVERKIIRNGTVTIEVADPTQSQPRIGSIAESHGGFVVTTESTQRAGEDRTTPEKKITVVMRVPAAKFNHAMADVRAAGLRVVHEKSTGQDVTEEFIDLEARIKNQKALENQFIEIMKRAGTVEDALNVQRELSNVRTEIERLDGRRRFLENQSSLSTINVTLQSPTEIVNATGFWYSVKSAFGDGVSAAVAIVLVLIRVIVAAIPLLLLIVLPAALIAKFVIKKIRRRKQQQEVETA